MAHRFYSSSKLDLAFSTCKELVSEVANEAMDKVVHLKELLRSIEEGKEERGKIKWILHNDLS